MIAETSVSFRPNHHGFTVRRRVQHSNADFQWRLFARKKERYDR
jgi:hypothetical protein